MNIKYKDLRLTDLKILIESLPKLKRIRNKKNLKVTIFGFFGMRNIGDDAILLTEIQQLRNLNPKIKIFVPSRYPKNIEKYKVTSFRFRNIPKLLLCLLQSDIVIFGGGGLFSNPVKHFTIKIFIVDLFFTIYKNFFFIIFPKILNRTVLVYGVGFYSNQNIIIKKISLFSIKYSDYISVRDRQSYILLKKFLPFKEINFLKDVAFSLNTADNNTPHNISQFSRLLAKDKKINVGVSLAAIGNYEYQENIITAVEYLYNKYSDNINFYFLPFYVNPYEINDLDIINKLKKRIKNTSNFIIIKNEIGVIEFLKLFRQLDMAICMRFHAQVFAYIQKTPFLGISYDEKCLSFLQDIENVYVKADTIDILNVENKFEAILSSIKNKYESNIS